MTPSKREKGSQRWEFPKCDGELEAVAFFFSAVTWWVKHPVRVSSIMMLSAIGFGSFSTVSNWVSDKVKVEDITEGVPAEPEMRLELMPAAIAQDKGGQEVELLGKKFLVDVNFQVWKLYGADALVIWDMQQKRLYKVQADVLSTKSIRQMGK